MHIASGLTLVRRDPAQSNGHGPEDRPRGRTWLPEPEQADALRTRLRKLLPGVILLTLLAALGALFPIVF